MDLIPLIDWQGCKLDLTATQFPLAIKTLRDPVLKKDKLYAQSDTAQACLIVAAGEQPTWVAQQFELSCKLACLQKAIGDVHLSAAAVVPVVYIYRTDYTGSGSGSERLGRSAC